MYPTWTFFSNHAHVLVTLAKDPSARIRDVADKVGITDRAVQTILAHLEDAGILVKERDGRRNRYIINESAPLRHPLEAHKTVGSLVRMILDPGQRPGD